ncbi:624_t:CDS:2 [Diversispora eburnea]|uniref:624_t:CDS:1 n=1 Tax=Diversispora eburnea TaxID=1213867 RepID=A0A9N8WE78_9GLOM|nr:624_t:CDS:2 [Diversispora eburnea]
MLNSSTFIFGTFVNVTYLVGIFRAIPLLTFHQSTANREDNQSKPTRYIPSKRSLATIYWTFVITFSLIVFILSFIRGYVILIRNDRMNNIISTIMLIIIGITNISIVFGYFKYGGLLFTLINECALITGGKDFKVKLQGEIHKAHVNKIRILSFSISILVLWSSTSYFIFAILGTLTKGNPVMLYILIIVNKFFSVFFILGTFAGIFYWYVVVDDADTFEVA